MAIDSISFGKGLFKRANKKENEKLSELRDYLLPYLMSGELDVSDLDI